MGSEPVLVAPHGDVLLDVTFKTSAATLKSAKKASTPRPTAPPPSTPLQPLKPVFTTTYRVSAGSLRAHSAYFERLLFDTRFAEAQTVQNALTVLSVKGILAKDAEAKDLPHVRIEDDDDASKAPGEQRANALAELLRVLHDGNGLLGVVATQPSDGTNGQVTKAAKVLKKADRAYRWTPTRPPSLLELATLAILADRFACVKPVAAYVRALKFKFPIAQVRARSSLDAPNSPPVLVNEESIRMKILIGWLLDQPLRFQVGTREVIIYGSRCWSPIFDSDEFDADAASWWDLPDNLESELQHRRDCILNCIASIPGHFLKLYTSRERQCKLGYGSSPACDSFQLGEMVRFLTNKELLVLGDFSPASCATATRDWSAVDVNHILTMLKQCPSYQVDSNHTNCGLRTRILPIIEYVQSMLSSNMVAIARPAWHSHREGATWMDEEVDGPGSSDEERVFKFTRGLSGDQRLRFEGAMAADRMARRLFTARTWDWTSDD